MIPRGFRFAGVRCALKNKRNDIGLIVSDHPTVSAGVFTKNVVHAACVDVTRANANNLRAVVVNSGNANCCTGEQGERDARRMADLASQAVGLPASEIGVASTGVIGQLLDMAKVEKGIHEAGTVLGEDFRPFMEAILTTDLVEKWAWASLDDPARVYGPGETVPASKGPIVLGVAKGSGMIAPNMATMLGFIVSDAAIESHEAQSALSDAVATSFNCLTVDGDTSTNDMVLLLANGAAGAVTPGAFQQALDAVSTSLAKQIARDGEGATKLIEVTVTGSADPKRIAKTIAESPLVKTAMFGCDPNWGRIMAAAGRAGVEFDPSFAKLTVRVGSDSFVLFEAGGPAVFEPARVSAALKSDHVRLILELGPDEPKDSATIYTCDFGYGYVRINAEYHT
ncbi:MAG: bifunctional glutamate N-acetyltransferase/amino-acid acetyltransferase ArgJ [Fimbriimonas sp.]